MLFGCALVIQLIDYFIGGHIRTQYIDPLFHFSYPLFPLPSFSTEVTYALFATMLILAICIAIGWMYRTALSLFFIGYTWMLFLDRTFFLNHYYLIWLLLILFLITDADRYCAADQYRKKRATSIPAWHLYIFWFQLFVVYFFSFLTKLNTDWIVHHQPIKLWLGNPSQLTTFLYVCGGLLIPLSAIPLLLIRQTRWAGICITIFFHTVNAFTFSIGVFPLLMICTTVLFLHPSTPRCLLPEPVTADSSTMHTCLKVPLILYCILQILLPLRHHLYDGNASWTEQGRTFAWQMKGRNKYVELTFHATQSDGTRVTINPKTYLNDYQHENMIQRPELIMQFAKFLDTQHKDDVVITVNAKASLNGKLMQEFINPNVDLTEIKDPITIITPLLP